MDEMPDIAMAGCSEALAGGLTAPRVGSLCILASGSGGNCSVLLLRGSNGPRVVLIDAGLSPRRTRRLLSECGLDLEHVEAIVLTHLDRDHWHPGWMRGRPAGLCIWAHKRHAMSGRRRQILPQETCAFDDSFEVGEACAVLSSVRISAALASHDELGVAAFRLEVSRPGGRGATLGYATDVGRMRDHLVEHLRGVDVLAIESNYCPLMQAASDRPHFLKRRITGGHGHLSNEEALEAVRRIEPRSHVVLLHLSRECNDPHLAASLHAGAPYGCTVTSQSVPTAWVDLCPCAADLLVGDTSSDGGAADPPLVQMPLFGTAGFAGAGAGRGEAGQDGVSPGNSGAA